MNAALPAGRLAGRLRVPGSKSVTNRALLVAGAAPGESVLEHPLDCDDTRVLARALERLGARVDVSDPAAWRVTGPLRGDPSREVSIDVGPAGTPARFLLALLAALPGRYVLDGSARMRERPMGPLADALRARGARLEALGREGFLPYRIHGGTLRGGRVALPGGVSSQFVSALLLASPLVPGGLEVSIDGPLASARYVDLTRRALAAYAGEGGYRAGRHAIPGDDSAACFPIAGALVSGGRVEIEGLDPSSEQADAVFRDWARRAGGRISFEDGRRLVVEGPPSGAAGLVPISVDVDGAPDAALPLATLLAFAGGPSTLTGTARLREKESDRLEAAADLLRRAGSRAEIREGARGPELLVGGAGVAPRAAAFAAHGDHRVAMSAAVLARALPAGSTLDDPGVVSKSWPDFFAVWARLGPPLGT